MSVSNYSIKTIAKNILNNNYVPTFIISVALMATVYLCNNIAIAISFVVGGIFSLVLLGILSVVLIAPLCLGVVRYFWRLSCGTRDNPVTIFYYFCSKKLYLKALHFLLKLVFKIGVTLLIFSIPAIIAWVVSSAWLYSIFDMSIPIWTVNLANPIRFLTFLAISLTIFSSFKYYLVPMLLVANEDLSVVDAFRLSSEISKRTTLDFIFFNFGFVGWFLLSVLIIPLIYTIPYYIVAYLVHCSYAVDSFNEKIAKINLDNIPTYVAGV